VNTDPRDHLFFPDALFLAGGGWPGSDWKGGRHQIGRLAAIRLEYLAALRWNSHKMGYLQSARKFIPTSSQIRWCANRGETMKSSKRHTNCAYSGEVRCELYREFDADALIKPYSPSANYTVVDLPGENSLGLPTSVVNFVS